jgi:hypothetical protein
MEIKLVAAARIELAEEMFDIRGTLARIENSAQADWYVSCLRQTLCERGQTKCRADCEQADQSDQRH